MKFGILNVFDAEGRPPAEVFGQALEQYAFADEQGWDYAWVAEHHFTWEYGILTNPATMLAALARETKRMRLGSAIVILPFHDPIRVAEDFALVDHLSDGRIDLGVGRGYQKPEFDGFGIPLAESTARFDDALEIIRRAWSGKAFSFEGAFHRVPEVTLIPAPLQQPHPPIWVAGQSPETMQKVAAMGLNLITGQNVGFRQFKQWVSEYREALVHHGHDPATREVAVSRFLYVTDDPKADIEAEAGPYLQRYWEAVAHQVASALEEDIPEEYKHHADGWRHLQNTAFGPLAARYLVAGTPDQVVGQLQALRDELGATQIICQAAFGGIPHDRALRTIELTAKDVMPRFQADTAQAAPQTAAVGA